MRALIGCGLAVLLVAGTAAAEDKIDAKKLVGKWEPKPDDLPKGKMVVEFMKDGKMTFNGEFGGTKQSFEGTYKLSGNTLTMTVKIEGKDDTKTRTITKLTDTVLVSKDDKGKEDTLTKLTDK